MQQTFFKILAKIKVLESSSYDLLVSLFRGLYDLEKLAKVTLPSVFVYVWLLPQIFRIFKKILISLLLSFRSHVSFLLPFDAFSITVLGVF